MPSISTQTWNPLRRLVLLALLVLGLSDARAQITLVVNKVPENTPVTDTLYLVGPFNNWTPGDRNFQFQKQGDGSYAITLPKENKPFEYKITRGAWATVEGDIHGGQLGNRIVHYFRTTPHTEYVQVLSWEDLSKVYSWDVVVQSVPKNTPFDAPIYISGNFNDWKEMDPAYRLTRLDDGTYAIKLSKTTVDTILYKFNRGSWLAVECRENGRILQNRRAAWNKGQTSTPVYVSIEGWEDLGGGKSLFLFMLLVMGACQGVVLSLGLLALKKPNADAVRALVFMTLLTSVALLARLSVYNHDVFEFQPKLYIMADLVYVLYAPGAYFLIKSITGVSGRNTGILVFFGAGIVALLAIYLPLFVMPRGEFVQGLLNRRFDSLFLTCAGLASCYNLVGFVLGMRLLNPELNSQLRDDRYRDARTYAMLVMGICGLFVLTWFFADIVYAVSALFNYETLAVLEAIVDFLWSLLALSIYVHSFLFLRFPERFRQVEDEAEAEQHIQPHHKEDLAGLKEQLAVLMEKSKPHLNAKLTLEDLAERMHVNLHTLSWLINEGHGKNFFDFVNEYRIEEFIRLSRQEKFRNYTFLALAMEAGFNSKTTFNRVFKKHTGKTPREYFGEAAVLKEEE